MADERAVRWAAAGRRVLLGTWLGSLCCFSFVVAPLLFRVLRTAPPDRRSPAPNAMAGDVVVPVLQSLAWMGMVVLLCTAGLLLLDPARYRIRTRLAALALGAVCILLSMAWLTPTMLDLLQQMGGPVDALAEDHPLRVSFNGLHRSSSAIHLGMIVSALLGLLLEPGAPAETAPVSDGARR